MRKFSLIVLMLSLTAAFGGLWAQSRVPLVVIASEGPAQVILSGRMIGVANPRLTAQVSPGNYELLVRKPGLPEFRQRISVGSGGLTINAPLGGVAVQPAPQPIQPIQPAPQPIQPIQPAPQPIQPAPRVIQPAPQPVQPAPQPQTLQQPQTFQPAPRVTQQAPQAQPTPQFSGPSGTAWTKVLQPQWPFTFLAEFPDGSIVVASEGSSDFYVKESSSNSLQKRTAPQTEGAWADIRGLFISSDGVLTAFANQVGVLRSRDKGLNWTAAGTIKQFNYPFMTSSGILLAGDNARQTQRSSDGGQTWQVVMQGEPQGPFAEAVDGSLYVYHGRKLKRSADQGRTWVELNPTSSVYEARILPYGSELILQAHSGNFDGARTTYVLSGNGQTTWESLPYLITHATQDKSGDIYAVLWEPVYDLFFPEALVRSEDGGRTYQPFMKGLPERIGYIQMWPAPYSGGMYITADGGPGGQTLFKLVY